MKRSTSIIMSLMLTLGFSFGAFADPDGSGTTGGGGYVERSIVVQNDSGTTGGGGKYQYEYRGESGTTGGGGK